MKFIRFDFPATFFFLLLRSNFLRCRCWTRTDERETTRRKREKWSFFSSLFWFLLFCCCALCAVLRLRTTDTEQWAYHFTIEHTTHTIQTASIEWNIYFVAAAIADAAVADNKRCCYATTVRWSHRSRALFFFFHSFGFFCIVQSIRLRFFHHRIQFNVLSLPLSGSPVRILQYTYLYKTILRSSFFCDDNKLLVDRIIDKTSWCGY